MPTSSRSSINVDAEQRYRKKKDDGVGKITTVLRTLRGERPDIYNGLVVKHFGTRYLNVEPSKLSIPDRLVLAADALNYVREENDILLTLVPSDTFAPPQVSCTTRAALPPSTLDAFPPMSTNPSTQGQNGMFFAQSSHPNPQRPQYEASMEPSYHLPSPTSSHVPFTAPGPYIPTTSSHELPDVQHFTSTSQSARPEQTAAHRSVHAPAYTYNNPSSHNFEFI